MKKCSDCKTKKEFGEFNRNKSHKDGYHHICRECDKQRNLNYYRSKEGLVTKLYRHQRSSSKQRGHAMPTYSKEELREWLYSQKKFHVLYDNYKRLDYQKDYIPSVDRIDDYIGYTMANIQLVTWRENRAKACKDKKEGRNNKQNKAVEQLCKDGSIANTYHSTREASRQTGVDGGDISRVCSGKQKTAGGFRWRFKNGN